MDDLKPANNLSEDEEIIQNDEKFLNPTPMLDELESGPWPSFVTGLKDLAERTKKPMLRGVMDQLEYSYHAGSGHP